jgi:hypothetical protein
MRCSKVAANDYHSGLCAEISDPENLVKWRALHHLAGLIFSLAKASWAENSSVVGR